MDVMFLLVMLLLSGIIHDVLLNKHILILFLVVSPLSLLHDLIC